MIEKFGWRGADNTIPHIVLPKNLTGTEANIIILVPENFPNKTVNDGIAERNLSKLKQEHGEVIFGAFDSITVSYAYISKQLDLSLKIKTAKNLAKYYVDKLTELKANVEFSVPSSNDFARIYDLNRKHANFVSMFGTFDAYSYHALNTFPVVKDLVKHYGDGKLKLLVTPSSSGALTGLASQIKKEYPYSKTLLIESSKSPYFYSGKKGEHELFGYSYGLIPLIHNIYTTDYVTIIDDKDVLGLFTAFETKIAELTELFGAHWNILNNFVGKFSFATIASVIASINIAKQLYLGDHDNIVIVAEELGVPYKSKTININKKDIEKLVINNLLEPEYKLTLDVTGQRHRERLFKKKMDYWLMRGVSFDHLENMRDREFWDKLL